MSDLSSFNLFQVEIGTFILLVLMGSVGPQNEQMYLPQNAEFYKTVPNAADLILLKPQLIAKCLFSIHFQLVSAHCGIQLFLS